MSIENTTTESEHDCGHRKVIEAMLDALVSLAYSAEHQWTGLSADKKLAAISGTINSIIFHGSRALHITSFNLKLKNGKMVSITPVEVNPFPEDRGKLH